MKYSVILVAMIATLATGIMAKDGKVEVSKNASANKAEPEKKDTANDKKAKAADEQKAERMTEMLERIKETDKALYKELAALKKKKPAAFEAEMAKILKKHHAEAGGSKDGERGKGGHGPGPRPYQNQLDRLPERGHNTDDKGR